MSFAKEAGLVLSLNQTIKTCTGILEAGKLASKRCRTKESKRANRYCIELYEAILYHLNQLKKKSNGTGNKQDLGTDQSGD